PKSRTKSRSSQNLPPPPARQKQTRTKPRSSQNILPPPPPRKKQTSARASTRKSASRPKRSSSHRQKSLAVPAGMSKTLHSLPKRLSPLHNVLLTNDYTFN